MEFSASQIASICGGEVVGNPDVTVSTVSKIEEGKPGSISFLSNKKYTHYIYETKASVVLVRKDFEPENPVSATLIKVDDPYSTVALLLKSVAEMIEPKYKGIESPVFVSEGVKLPEDCYIGAFAYIGRGVQLGDNVKIFPQVYIGDNCIIGDNTVLKPGVKVYHNCVIGKNCIIHSGAVIGADGFGFAPVNGEYEKIPQIGNVVIEDNVEIGANTCVDRATMGSTKVHKGVKLDNLIQIAHNCEVGEHTVMASQSGMAGSSKLGSHCMIGGQVGFAGHISVGDNVNVGAQSGIPRSIPSDSTIMGSPATDFRQFARQCAVIKDLPEIASRLKALEKTVKK